MKRKSVISLITGVFILLFLPTAAYATPSWIWLTMTPLNILPYAAIATILIETFIICKFNSINKSKNIAFAFLFICLANLLSFILPYSTLASGYAGITYEHHSFAGIIEAIEFGVGAFPYYIVGGFFLFLTLVVEIPVVYASLRGKVANAKRLIIVTLCANTLTTVIIAVIERILCRGHW